MLPALMPKAADSESAAPALVQPGALRAELAALEADQSELFTLMRSRLSEGRAAIRAVFEEDSRADDVLHRTSALIDALITGALDYAQNRLYRRPNPTRGEKLAVLAVGGYGRAEMAPGSDVDLLVLYPYKCTPHTEQMTEFLLYKLWDLGLKVGHATRSISDCISSARDDPTIGTALLEARFIWGDPEPFEVFQERFESQIISGNAAGFIEAKLTERDERLKRVGTSRFLLEPNVKEGKGGLRDLQTLTWLGRFIYRIDRIEDLVGHNVLTRQDARAFLKARQFLWTVRCHLHYLTGRAEERLTFDLQPEVARRMSYRDRRGSLGVERFMKHYYLHVRDVGALTRIVCAFLEEQHRRRPRFRLANFGFGQRKVDGFIIQGGRVDLDEPDLFEHEPVKLLRLFHLAERRGLDIHPDALRAATKNLARIDTTLRDEPEANRLFLETLTSTTTPAIALGRMNETGLLSRFIPDFGRVVAQMQHDLYHVYTVDEHTVRAIGILSDIEHGTSVAELPLSTEIMPKIQSRTALYVALFFHDIGKGRGGDHSKVGARIAARTCSRLGLSEEQTETVVWLVRHHLVMSNTAFKRDIEDPKTVTDFVEIVQSPERLRLLLLLTVADIRAVGPNVWNGWKGQLLRELYQAAEVAMAGGDLAGRRTERAEAAQAELRQALADMKDHPWSDAELDAYTARHDHRYWLGFSAADHVRHAVLIRDADNADRTLTLDFRVDAFRDRTEMLLYAQDHHGLFTRLAGALSLSGVNIADAHIFTTNDGMAFDVLGLQTAEGTEAVEETQHLERIRRHVTQALSGELHLAKALKGRRTGPSRADVFQVEPRVLIDNAASRTNTVIEVNGRDRPGLLYAVLKALNDLGLVIRSAHISTYGERVVDVFYVRDVFGLKIAHKTKLKRVREQLGKALSVT